MGTYNASAPTIDIATDSGLDPDKVVAQKKKEEDAKNAIPIAQSRAPGDASMFSASSALQSGSSSIPVASSPAATAASAVPVAAQNGAPAPAPAPGAPAGPVDRVALAKSAWDTFERSTNPAYKASLDAAAGKAASVGQLGSGQLRTSLGDLAGNRALALDTERDRLINSAVEGSIGDYYANAGLDLSKRSADLSEKVGLGNLELAKSGQAFQQGMAGKQFELSEKLGLGNLNLAQAQQALDEKVRTGALTLDQARQALAEKQAQTQQEQFASSQDQQLSIAKMGDTTANRGIDANAALANNEWMLKLLEVLKQMGWDPKASAPAGAAGATTPGQVTIPGTDIGSGKIPSGPTP